MIEEEKKQLNELMDSFVGKENTVDNQTELVDAILELTNPKIEIVCDDTNNNEQTRKENMLICDIYFYEQRN